MRVRAFNSKLDKAFARTRAGATPTTLSKTPLGALHWRVRFRRTVTYRPSIWILSRLPTCRSELGQPWHPPFPANPSPTPSYRPPSLCPSEFYAWQFCSFRGIVSREIQSAKFLRLSYTRLSETNGLGAAPPHLVTRKIFNGTHKRTKGSRTTLKYVSRSIITVSPYDLYSINWRIN